MSQSISKNGAAPWPRTRMEQHVRQRIRDFARRRDDDPLTASLSEVGEDAVWRAVLDAIEEAGWIVTPVFEP